MKGGHHEEVIHHIGTKAGDIPFLMDSFYEVLNGAIRFACSDGDWSDQFLQENHAAFDPLSVIAILSFTFTLIHPLPDGNGRTHRLVVHYLLERFEILDSWLIPISIIILHDNSTTGLKDKVLKDISEPIIRRTKYHFDADGQLHVTNATKIFYQSWDATEAVEYFYQLLAKATRVSVDCAMYVQIWDEALLILQESPILVSPAHLKTMICRYIQNGAISKNTVKQLSKQGIQEDLIIRIAEVCQRHLSKDPHAFKEHFESMKLASLDYVEQFFEHKFSLEDR